MNGSSLRSCTARDASYDTDDGVKETKNGLSWTLSHSFAAFACLYTWNQSAERTLGSGTLYWTRVLGGGSRRLPFMDLPAEDELWSLLLQVVSREER